MKVQVWKKQEKREDLPPAPPSLSPSSEGLPTPPPPIGESAGESASVEAEEKAEEGLPPAPPEFIIR